MIRLIASDIDGTLLQNGATQISQRLIRQIRELKEYGILFAPASGRQYRSLRRLFAPVREEVVYLAETGGAVYQDGVCIHSHPMDMEIVRDLTQGCLEREGCEILLSGADISYFIPKNPEYVPMMLDYYQFTGKTVERVEDIPEPIVKTSMYSYDGAQSMIGWAQRRWGNDLQVVISGPRWIDLTSCDKGTGLRALCSHLGISLDEVMAFGDSQNDTAMLDIVGHPYIMSGAVEEMRCRYPNTPTVEDKLEELLEQLRAEQSAQ